MKFEKLFHEKFRTVQDHIKLFIKIPDSEVCATINWDEDVRYYINKGKFK